MQKQNIQGVYPKKKFKYTKTEHKKYPYLLNDLTIIPIALNNLT
jgi:hypothetical protein